MFHTPSCITCINRTYRQITFFDRTLTNSYKDFQFK